MILLYSKMRISSDEFISAQLGRTQNEKANTSNANEADSSGLVDKNGDPIESDPKRPEESKGEKSNFSNSGKSNGPIMIGNKNRENIKFYLPRVPNTALDHLIKVYVNFMSTYSDQTISDNIETVLNTRLQQGNMDAVEQLLYDELDGGLNGDGKNTGFSNDMIYHSIRTSEKLRLRREMGLEDVTSDLLGILKMGARETSFTQRLMSKFDAIKSANKSAVEASISAFENKDDKSLGDIMRKYFSSEKKATQAKAKVATDKMSAAGKIRSLWAGKESLFDIAKGHYVETFYNSDIWKETNKYIDQNVRLFLSVLLASNLKKRIPQLMSVVHDTSMNDKVVLDHIATVYPLPDCLLLSGESDTADRDDTDDKDVEPKENAEVRPNTNIKTIKMSDVGESAHGSALITSITRGLTQSIKGLHIDPNSTEVHTENRVEVRHPKYELVKRQNGTAAIYSFVVMTDESHKAGLKFMFVTDHGTSGARTLDSVRVSLLDNKETDNITVVSWDEALLLNKNDLSKISLDNLQDSILDTVAQYFSDDNE